MSFQAEGNNVILVLDLEETVSAGGIVIQRRRGDHPNFGKVISVGPGDFNSHGVFIPLEGIAEGNTVYFDKAAASGIFIDGENFVCVKSSAVLAVLED